MSMSASDPAWQAQVNEAGVEQKEVRVAAAIGLACARALKLPKIYSVHPAVEYVHFNVPEYPAEALPAAPELQGITAAGAELAQKRNFMTAGGNL